MESRTAINFYVKLGMTPTQTFEKISEPKMKFTVSRRLVFKWHKRFREGIDSLNDDARSGRPVTSDDLVTSVQLRGQRFENRHYCRRQPTISQLVWARSISGMSTIGGYIAITAASRLGAFTWRNAEDSLDIGCPSQRRYLINVN